MPPVVTVTIKTPFLCLVFNISSLQTIPSVFINQLRITDNHSKCWKSAKITGRLIARKEKITPPAEDIMLKNLHVSARYH